jgi:hypothetical protein
MSHSLISRMISVFNLSKKVLPSSVNFCHSTHLWKTIEVRIDGVAEKLGNTNTGTLSSSRLESIVSQNENYKSRLLKIAIIGVPNAGKSTVINQLVGRRVSTNRYFIAKSVPVSIYICFLHNVSVNPVYEVWVQQILPHESVYVFCQIAGNNCTVEEWRLRRCYAVGGVLVPARRELFFRGGRVSGWV